VTAVDLKMDQKFKAYIRKWQGWRHSYKVGSADAWRSERITRSSLWRPMETAIRNITYRYNKITDKLRFSDKLHYSLATNGVLHSFTLQPLCVIFSISKQTANSFVTVQFAGPRNSFDNTV
jgi:hypothetical protein